MSDAGIPPVGDWGERPENGPLEPQTSSFQEAIFYDCVALGMFEDDELVSSVDLSVLADPDEHSELTKRLIVEHDARLELTWVDTKTDLIHANIFKFEAWALNSGVVVCTYESILPAPADPLQHRVAFRSTKELYDFIEQHTDAQD